MSRLEVIGMLDGIVYDFNYASFHLRCIHLAERLIRANAPDCKSDKEHLLQPAVDR